MAGGGFIKLPNGKVVVALTLPRPSAEGGTARFLVLAANRARALTKLRNLGLRAVYLRGNTEPPTPDEVTAVLHHPDGLLWRATQESPDGLWQPIRFLLRPMTPSEAMRSSAPPPAVPATPLAPSPSTRRTFPPTGHTPLPGPAHARN